MAARMDDMRHLGVFRHPLMHGLDPQLVRHVCGQILGHLEAVDVRHEEEVEEEGLQIHRRCLDPIHLNLLSAYFWMVSR